MPARNRNNLLLLFAFIVLVIGSLAVAYNSGGPPSSIGHSSDEINFIIEPTTNATCTGQSASTCVAQCPDPTSTAIYHVVSGGCISANAIRNRQAGSCTLGNCGTGIDNGWFCQDSSHVQGQEFIAYVHCLKGGP